MSEYTEDAVRLLRIIFPMATFRVDGHAVNAVETALQKAHDHGVQSVIDNPAPHGLSLVVRP